MLFSSLMRLFLCSLTFSFTDRFCNGSFIQYHCIPHFTTCIIYRKFYTVLHIYKLRLVEGFRTEWTVCLFCTASRLELELTWPPIEWLSGFIFPWIERLGRETHHSPPSFSRSRMCGLMSSLSSLRGHSHLYIYWVQVEQWTLGKVALVRCGRKCKTCSNETLTTTTTTKSKSTTTTKTCAAEGAPTSKQQAEKVPTSEQLCGSRPFSKSKQFFSFMFLLSCVVSKAWRNNTNKMQQYRWFIVNCRCWLLTTVSTCFGHLYAHHQEKRPRVTAYGVFLLVVLDVAGCGTVVLRWGCEHCEGCCSSSNLHSAHTATSHIKHYQQTTHMQ